MLSNRPQPQTHEIQAQFLKVASLDVKLTG